jgi:hypothetical protein
MTDERAAPTRRIDVTRLPEDVVELIDALGPDEDLVITRDGDPVAAISSMRDALDGAIIEPGSSDEAAGQPLMDYDNVTATATPSLSATSSLAAKPGDLRSSPPQTTNPQNEHTRARTAWCSW